MFKQVRARFANGRIEYNNNGLASQGFTTARIVEVPISEFEVKVEIGKRLNEIFNGTDIAGNKSVRRLGMGVRLGDYVINANLANTSTGQPYGYVVIGGKIVVDTSANQHWSALIVWNNGKVTIEKIDRNKVKDMKYAVSCTPVIAKDGKIHVTSRVDKTPADMMVGNRRPRTVIGIKGDKIIGAVVDGDSAQNAGMSVDHVSALLIDQGATDLINMDGGGSSSMLKLSQTTIQQPQNNTNTTPLYKSEVTASALNIRSLPNTTGRILGTYPQGTVVDILEESNGWGRTNLGWISLSFTKKKEVIKAVESLYKLNLPFPYVVDHIPITTPNNRRPNRKLTALDGIVIHSTANPTSTALNERNWLTNPSNTRTASWHIVVDDTQAIEAIPLDEVAWHAGDGNGAGNTRHISIEICESGNRAKTIQNAIILVAELLRATGKSIKDVKQHFDFNGKNCPRILRTGTLWQDFINAIDNIINPKPVQPPTNINPTNPNQNVDVQTQLGLEALQYLHENKIIDTPASWQGKMREQAENWLVFVLAKRIHEQLNKK